MSEIAPGNNVTALLEIFKLMNYQDILYVEGDSPITLYEAVNSEDQAIFIKVIDKNALKKEENYSFIINHMNMEREISKSCYCNHTLKLIRVFESKNYIFFEKEYCDKNLEEYINQYGPLEYDFQIFKQITIDLAKALKFIIENGIFHRNIKPNNIYIQELENEKYIIKLGNFESAIYMKEINNSLPMGTLYYTAPEILKNLDYEYNEKCEMWSLGVTLFEIYFGFLPYGINPRKNMNYMINDETKFIYRKSGIPTLDILFKRLLQINPDKRMSFLEYYDYVTNKDFLKKDVIAINNNKKYIKLYKEILKEKQTNNYSLYRKEHTPELEDIESIIDLIKEENIPEIMRFSKENFSEGEIFNNIIFYDNNIEYHHNLINKDYETLEKEANGTFILCTNLKSLNIIKNEITKIIKYENRFVFNIITNGKGYEKELKQFLGENKEFRKCINKICIFCIKVEKYLKYKQKEPELIYDVTNTIKNVINFIKKFSSKDIKPYHLTKLISLKDYFDKYKERHKKISRFYGNLNKDNFPEFNEIKYESEKIITFNLERDLSLLRNFFAKKINNKTFYGDINRYLMIEKWKYPLHICYLTSRLMYFLNYYAVVENKYCKENNKILFKGTQLNYSSLLPFQQSVGKIIMLSTFNLVFDDKKIAETRAGRKNEKQENNNSYKFSVMFHITNLYKKEWIPNCIKVDKNSLNEEVNEGEFLLQAFSFYRVKKAEIDYKNYNADIFMETIGKKEILEDKIRLGKEIKYNEKENIMEIVS